VKLIQTITLTSAQASIEFTSIPQTFTDLVVLASVRSDYASRINLGISFNGVTTNLSWRRLNGSGSGVSSGNGTGVIVTNQDVNGTSVTANTFNNYGAYIPNYTSSASKSVSIDSVGEANATESYQVLTAGLWSSTAAINSIQFVTVPAANFIAGSTMSLYGITKGSDGIVTTL
jgi:hypothetical protein